MELSRGQVTNALNLEVATFTRGAIYATPKSDTIVSLIASKIIIFVEMLKFSPPKENKNSHKCFFL
jgi:hypothetical protein